jgi:hypothetical protein
MWLPPFGVPLLLILGCPELCLVVLLICLIVGGPFAGLGVLWCGKWSLHASSSVYGRKGDRYFEDRERTLGKILSLFMVYPN